MSFISETYRTAGQKLGLLFTAPSKAQVQILMLGVGAVLLSTGLTQLVHAQGIGTDGVEITFQEEKIGNVVATVFQFLEGAFGALIMVVAGIGAILSAAFGQYKAAIGCLVVAVGSFILRSFVETFFNTDNIPGMGA